MINCSISYAQEESHLEIQSDKDKIPSTILKSIDIHSATDQAKTIFFDEHTLPLSLYMQNMPMIESDLRQDYRLKRFILTPYCQQTAVINMFKIKSAGAEFIWNNSKRTSFEFNTYYSQQYGFVERTVNVSWGSQFYFRYHIDKKIAVCFWGRYVFHPNQDPFLNAANSFSNTGTGVKLEYNLNDNTKFSIDIGKQKDYENSKKLEYTIEGKANIRF